MPKSSPFHQILFGAALVLAVAAAFIFIPRPAPDLSAYARVNGEYNVRILRDTWGVPHIFGRTDADTAFGLAYAHAEDDFLTIQQVLVATRGRLATVYGADAAPNDYMVQLLRIWDVVETGYARDLNSDTRAVLEAYAEGLNTYAALHPNEILWPGLYPLSGIDIAATSVHRSPLFFGLDDVLGDLFAEDRQSEVASPGGETARWPEQIEGDHELAWNKSIAGSNTFALGPERTTDGSTMLAVNSHQPWEGPVAWYEAHVHSEAGWDMTGALFPGSPVIIHGHNRALGWSFTVNDPDLVDVYVLETNPENEGQYLLDGEWRKFEVRSAPLHIKIIGNLVVPVRQEFLWSAFGPVVRRPHGTYAVRYAGFGRVDIWQQLYSLNKASNFDEWLSAMRSGGLPMFNVAYADRAGNIYYLYNSFLPIRQEGWDWSLYMPGTSSDLLWTDTLPFEQLPQVLNPESGFIQNANSSPFQTSTAGNPDPSQYSKTFGIETVMTNRSLRLLELLGGHNKLSFEEFIAVKWDMAYSRQSDVPHHIGVILRANFTDPLEIEGQYLLSRWDLRVDPQNPAAALAVLTLANINEAYGPFRPSTMVGVEVPDEIVINAFRNAVSQLAANFGRIDLPWAAVNRLERGSLNLGLGGGPDILHAVYGRRNDDGTLRGIAGDGVVYLVRWLPDGTVESYSIHQYGSATLDSASPHYADQAPLFASRMLKPVWFDEPDILANLEAAYAPGEELGR